MGDTCWTGPQYPARGGTKLAKDLMSSARGTYELGIQDVVMELERLGHFALAEYFGEASDENAGVSG